MNSKISPRVGVHGLWLWMISMKTLLHGLRWSNILTLYCTITYQAMTREVYCCFFQSYFERRVAMLEGKGEHQVHVLVTLENNKNFSRNQSIIIASSQYDAKFNVIKCGTPYTSSACCRKLLTKERLHSRSLLIQVNLFPRIFLKSNSVLRQLLPCRAMISFMTVFEKLCNCNIWFLLQYLLYEIQWWTWGMQLSGFCRAGCSWKITVNHSLVALRCPSRNVLQAIANFFVISLPCI